MEKQYNIKAIQTSDGFFVYSDDINLQYLLFDSIKPEKTWKSDWYKVKSIDNIKKIVPEKRNIASYILKPEYVPSDSLPSTVKQEFFLSDGDEYASEHKLYGLYEPQYKIEPETYEDIDVKTEVIAEIDGALVEQKIHFPVYGKYPNTDGKNWSVTNSSIKLGLLDELITPSILREERPCKLSSEDSYKIIRTHIKDNINPKVAVITSDHDFCLSVEKRIPLSEKVKFTYDANFSIFGRRRKPKMVVDYKTERKVKVFETAPEIRGIVYSGYTKTPEFVGENAETLKSNIDLYLKTLMEEINKPLLDCPHCKGLGVIED